MKNICSFRPRRLIFDRAQCGGDGLRFCLHPSAAGRQRASPPLSDPSCFGGEKIYTARHGISVSAVMLYRIDAYRNTLRAHSGFLMNFIEWQPTPERNVAVLNDTGDMYRYFDCTEAAEFLYACVERAIDRDLPQEISFLRRNDEAMRRIMNSIEMPDRMAENLVRVIHLNEGKLGSKRREGECEKLTDDEVASIESIVREAFDGFKT